MNRKPPDALPSVSETLRTTPLFAAFPDADMEAVAHFCHVRSFRLSRASVNVHPGGHGASGIVHPLGQANDPVWPGVGPRN